MIALSVEEEEASGEQSSQQTDEMKSKMAGVEANAEMPADYKPITTDMVIPTMKVQQSGQNISASIEETNRIRIAMGMKPLSTGPSKQEIAAKEELLKKKSHLNCCCVVFVDGS